MKPTDEKGRRRKRGHRFNREKRDGHRFTNEKN
jgi:hypothetical protein